MEEKERAEKKKKSGNANQNTPGGNATGKGASAGKRKADNTPDTAQKHKKKKKWNPVEILNAWDEQLQNSD